MSEKLNLARIEALAVKASEGPLVACYMGDPETGHEITDHKEIVASLEKSVSQGSGRFYGVHPADSIVVIAHTGNGPTSEANALFFADARQSVPLLAAKLRESRRLLSRLAGLCECYGIPQGAAVIDAFLDSITWEDKSDGK